MAKDKSDKQKGDDITKKNHAELSNLGKGTFGLSVKKGKSELKNLDDESSRAISKNLKYRLQNLPEDTFLIEPKEFEGIGEDDQDIPIQLPIILSESVSNAPIQPVEWEQIRSLPGYSMSPIRGMGRAVFAQWLINPMRLFCSVIFQSFLCIHRI